MGTLYRTVFGPLNDEVEREVRSGKVPGVSIHEADDPKSLWRYALTDGKNYLWPEGAEMLLTWGTNDPRNILSALHQHLGVRVISEHDPAFYD